MDPLSEPSGMGPRADALASRLEPYMLGAALLTLPVIVLEEIAVREVGRDTAVVLNWAIWFAFTAELVAMLVVVEDRWRYLRTHPLELAIVLLTSPLLPALFGALRTLRLVRVVRLLPLVRAVLSTRRILSLEGLRFIGLITLSLVLLAGLAFSRLETAADGSDISAWDGIWWAITTVTTVGYGDLAPQSATGRSLAIVVMIPGIGFVAMLTAAAAEYFVRAGVAAGSPDHADPADLPPRSFRRSTTACDALKRRLRSGPPHPMDAVRSSPKTASPIAAGRPLPLLDQRARTLPRQGADLAAGLA